ncbi:MAG: hypothetical protein AVDCRST_MAG27-2010, partial [uncultured Craurococcus sp.]
EAAPDRRPAPPPRRLRPWRAPRGRRVLRPARHGDRQHRAQHGDRRRHQRGQHLCPPPGLPDDTGGAAALL